jgi:hypothetical protein
MFDFAAGYKRYRYGVALPRTATSKFLSGSDSFNCESVMVPVSGNPRVAFAVLHSRAEYLSLRHG